MTTVLVSNIKWDVFDEDQDIREEDIPTSCELAVDDSFLEYSEEEQEDIINEMLESIYGFCHNGYTYEIKQE